MKSVFVVTSGSYSDYRIAAVFSTRALADLYVERHDKTTHSLGSWEVVEWALDDWDKREMPRTQWWAGIDLLTGKMCRKGKKVVMALPQTRVPADSLVTAKRLKDTYVSADGKRRFYVASFVSSAHAKKRAVEARQEWVRMKA